GRRRQSAPAGPKLAGLSGERRPEGFSRASAVMMRLPHFNYHSPRTVREAAELLAAPGGAMLVAGGTDLLPKMKRRPQVPPTLIGLRRVAELREFGDSTIGAGVTLTGLVRSAHVRDAYRALWQAAS